MREVLRMVESAKIYVVPVFISEGYFTQTVIPRELELQGRMTIRDGKEIYYCEPVGSHPGLTSLFIVGHGTDLNDNSAKAAKEQAARIRAIGDYAQVVSSYMEESPLISDWHKISQQPNVVIVPFFIADGLHSFQDIPVLIGIGTESDSTASQGGVFRRNPYRLHGKKLFYASAIGTEPMIADVILDQVLAAAGGNQ